MRISTGNFDSVFFLGVTPFLNLEIWPKWKILCIYAFLQEMLIWSFLFDCLSLMLGLPFIVYSILKQWWSKVYLNYSKCTWKVSIHHTIIESRATRHSAVSAFTETVELLIRLVPCRWLQARHFLAERQEIKGRQSSLQCLWDIAAAWLAVKFF